MPELLANRADFRFTAYIDLSTGEAKYHHVYSEGLNIERIGTEEADEDFLIFGVFNPKDI